MGFSPPLLEGSLGHFGEELEMAVSDVTQLAVRQELLATVFTECFQQAVASLFVARLGHNQGLLHQPGHELQYVSAADLIGSRHRGGGFERKAAPEDGESPEHFLLRGSEQQVAPVDGGAQCLWSAPGTASTSREKAEAIAQVIENPNRGEHVDLGGGELNGKRDAVQMPTDGADGLPILGSRLERRQRQLRPIDEESRGFVLVGVVGALRGISQRGDPKGELSVDFEQLPTGGQHTQGGACP